MIDFSKCFKNIGKKILLGSISFCMTFPAFAEYVPTPENIQARKEFSESRFGIFIHWGIYSMFGQGEWYLNNGELKNEEYSKAASAFYPANFDAKEWVSAIKATGAKYICFTTRHHDSFSMYDTKYSDYNVVDATPFKRDVLKELADECRKQGIKLHLYYSHLDWAREDYYPLGRTGHKTGRKKAGNWNDYYKFMNNQLTELLTNYGPVGAIWFDGLWDQPKDFNWGLKEQYALIHKLQPACLVGNNHHREINEGEDIQMFERDLPGENKSGLAGQDISHLPLETCITMNGMWGYKVKDQNYKSAKTLIRLLVRSAGKSANLLLNVGPQPNGEIPAAALERMAEIGKWMNKYGNTIYGTSGYGVSNSDWGTVTCKGKELYVHILADSMPEFVVIPVDGKVKSVVKYDDESKVGYEKINGGVVLHTKSLNPDTDCVIKVTLR